MKALKTDRFAVMIVFKKMCKERYSQHYDTLLQRWSKDSSSRAILIDLDECCGARCAYRLKKYSANRVV